MQNYRIHARRVNTLLLEKYLEGKRALMLNQKKGREDETDPEEEQSEYKYTEKPNG